MLAAQEKIKKTGSIYRAAIVKKLSNHYQQRNNLIAANFNKVTASAMNHLRLNLQEADSKVVITKISLLRNFLKDLAKDNLFEQSLGHPGLIFVGNDIVAASKVLSEFAKEHEQFKILGAFYQEKKFSGLEIDRIAKLPSRTQLLANAVMAIKSPLFRLRMVLETPTRKLVLCLISAKDKKK